MTHNQIEYWNLQETQRHNLAGEGETKRHNVAGETETNRHNVATETVEIGKLNETVRHNTVTERESERHNRESENIGYGQLNESIRHNTVTESIQRMDAQTRADQLAESVRHNKAAESIDRLGVTSGAIGNVTKAASEWISTPKRTTVTTTTKNKNSKGSKSETEKTRKVVTTGGGIAAGIKSAAKRFSNFDPLLVPKTIFERNTIKPNSKKGTYSA